MNAVYGMNRQTGQRLVGVAHVRQSIHDILTTPLGSRIMRADYGSRLMELIDQPHTESLALSLSAATAEALGRCEARFTLQHVTVRPENNRLHLSLVGTYRPDGSALTLSVAV